MRDGGAREADPRAGRVKKAELLGGVGALVLGAGLGLLLSSFLKPYAVPLLVVGLLAHAWGMYDKHRLEAAAPGARPRWAELLYRACWAALLILAVYLVAKYTLRG